MAHNSLELNTTSLVDGVFCDLSNSISERQLFAKEVVKTLEP